MSLGFSLPIPPHSLISEIDFDSLFAYNFNIMEVLTSVMFFTNITK